MKLKSSPRGAPCDRMRRASSNSEFLSNSRCPRTAEIFAGESRNTRDRGALRSEGLDPWARDASFIGGILTCALSDLLSCDYIQSGLGAAKFRHRVRCSLGLHLLFQLIAPFLSHRVVGRMTGVGRGTFFRTTGLSQFTCKSCCSRYSSSSLLAYVFRNPSIILYLRAYHLRARKRIVPIRRWREVRSATGSRGRAALKDARVHPSLRRF